MLITKISASPKTQSPLHNRLLMQILRKSQIKVNSKDSGFTLIELLVAMAILTIVVGITGTGLLFIISTNTKSDIQITQQSNIRRAADFISDEIKAASLVTTTDPVPVWITGGFTNGINPVKVKGTASAKLYLEIPMLVENVTTAATPSVFTITNHGLATGNAIRLSGTGLPPVGSDTVGNLTTYYVKTTPDINNTFTLVDSSNANVFFSATTIPKNFAIRRLVVYYTDTPNTATPDITQWKGPSVLYRATGDCSAFPTNCRVMIDSLTDPLVAIDSLTSPVVTAPVLPFVVDTSTNPYTLTINGQICAPASMANICTTTSPCTSASIAKNCAISKQTVQAASRATLK